MKRIVLSTSLLLTTLLLAIISFSSSCKKDETTTTGTTYTVQGLWTGNHQITGSTPLALNMSLKPDGNATYEDIISGTYQFCAGTWTLTGTTLTVNTTCIYGQPVNVGVKQTFTGTFDAATGTLTAGQWSNTYPPASAASGTFTLTKAK